MRNKKGFTLIELLIVIAIIGVLATIVIVNFNSSRVKSRDAKRQGDINGLRSALEIYNNNNSVYLTTSTSFSASLAPLVTSGFINSVPVDPKNSDVYVYQYAGDADGYALGVTYETGARPGVACKVGVAPTRYLAGITAICP